MNTFESGDLYLCAYLLMFGAPLPTVRIDPHDSHIFCFDDPTGEVAWLEQAYVQDKSVQRFVNSLRRIRGLLKGI